MTGTAQFVEIGSSAYEVYADLAYADDYLAAETDAEAWRAAEDITKNRALVTAVRVMDTLNWAGSKCDADQELQWPRKNVTGVTDGVTPAAILNANAELANAVLNGVDLANMVSTTETQKSIKAGSVAVENFRGVGLAARQYPLPKTAWLLMSQYLASSGATGVRSNGTDGETISDDDYDHNQAF